MMILASLFIIADCNFNPNAAKIVGDWIIETMSINGEVINPEEKQKDAIQFTFKQDGTGVIKGDSVSADMKWTIEDDTVSFGNDNTTIKGTLKEDKLYVDKYGGDLDLVMAR